MAEQTCKTCELWGGGRDADMGKCYADLPFWARESLENLHSIGRTWRKDGSDCDAWREKGE